MTQQEILLETSSYIHQLFREEASGHDWWHIERVRKLSLKIGKEEKADLFLVELAALLHDLDDWKLNESKSEFLTKTEAWLRKCELNSQMITRVINIIKQISFKGAGVNTTPDILEAKIVQDADRLDAIGAIGIARTFSYGGNKNRLLYHPNLKPELHDSFEAYKANNGHTINHFYEKLLLLKDRMNTDSAKKMADKRHEFMEQFLDQFYSEWETTN